MVFCSLASVSLLAGITWGKVVSLYSVAAGLAIDCVRQAQPAMVHALVDCLGEFVRKTLAPWLRRRGGWVRGDLRYPVRGGGGKGLGEGEGPGQLLLPSSSADLSSASSMPRAMGPLAHERGSPDPPRASSPHPLPATL